MWGKEILCQVVHTFLVGKFVLEPGMDMKLVRVLTFLKKSADQKKNYSSIATQSVSPASQGYALLMCQLCANM